MRILLFICFFALGFSSYAQAKVLNSINTKNASFDSGIINDENSMRDLARAAHEGRGDIMQLINFNWSPGAINNAIWHVKENDEATLRALLEHPNADINFQDARGQTPLMFAGYNKSKHLLEHGANAKLTDRLGETALMKAAHPAGDLSTMELLLPYSQINAVDKWGESAIFHAASNIHKGYGSGTRAKAIEKVKLLIAHPDIRINLKNKRGFNVLQVVQSYVKRTRDTKEYQELESFLERSGLDGFGLCAKFLARREEIKRDNDLPTMVWPGEEIGPRMVYLN